MKTFMLSCKKATELTEKRHHFGLSLSESVQWRMHLAMCSACKLYSRQSAIIEQALEHSIAHLPPPTQASDAEAQDLIDKILKK